MQKAQTNRLVGATIILLLVAAGSSLMAWWNPLEKQQLYLSNFLYYERPTKNQVVVVSIDNETVGNDGLGKFSSWCRTYYIPALQNLNKYQPKVIGLDITFITKSKGICQDDLTALLESNDPAADLQKYRNQEMHPDDVALGQALKPLAAKVVLLTKVDDMYTGGKPYLSEKSLIDSPIEAIGGQDEISNGHSNIYYDLNGVIRGLIPVFEKNQTFIPALSVNILQKIMGIETDVKFNIRADSLTITDGSKSLFLPLDNYQFLINYSEKPNFKAVNDGADGHIIIIPFIDIYKNSQDFSSLIKDKIVLIGARFTASEDKYLTPIDPKNEQHGVMIHAQAIQTILDQAWLRNQTMPEQIGTIGLMAAAALALVFLLQIGWALPLLLVLIGVYTMAAAPLLFRSQGLILNMVYPPLAVVAAAVAGYAYRYVSESRQKTRVAGALGQYVNTRVAEQVLGSDESQVRTGGEKRQVTVLFTDIRGFTTISEALQPQSLVALLNEYFEIMSAVIVRNGGVVDKFEGDALMAFFEDQQGLPAGQAERAALAALEMLSERSKLNAKWHSDPPLPGGEKKPEIDFRVGISSGEAVVGNIGSSQHIQYTVIGDIVNLGSRLESANKKYQTHIMIPETTFELIRNKYECRFLDMIRVKGKDKPVKTYELLCPAGELSDDQRELIQTYNKALALYFQRQFAEALEVFQKEVFTRWPADVLSNFYAGRCELLKRFPPKPDWDFVYKMESK